VRGHWRVAAVVIAAAVVLAAATVSARHGSPDKPPFARARAFTLPPVDAGQPAVSLAATPGRPVVLTFFAAWCGPCTAELPVIEQAWRAFQGEGPGAPTVVGVDELDQKPAGPGLIRQTGVTFPSGYDHDGAVGRTWAVNGLPITVFITGAGRLVSYHRGQLNRAQFDALVQRLRAAR
jgi:cytochrome c biogenesis protein CcmG, thiol:disulfide interchange protein DsbE